MTIRPLSAALACALLCGAAALVARSGTTPKPGPDAATPAPTGTLILTVEIDHRGARVLQATRKPGLAFRAPRHADDMPFAWTLVDAEARALAAGGFDPARVCLDPAHAGLPPHVEGDVPVPHVAHVNVKVPDLTGVAGIEFALREGGTPRPFGSSRRDAFPVR